MKRIELLENFREEELEEIGIDYRFYRAYKNTQKLNLEFLNIDNIGFIGNLEKTMDNIERFKIIEFTVSDQSINLMKAMEIFQKRLYLPTQITKIKTGRTHWNFEEDRQEEEIAPTLHFTRI